MSSLDTFTSEELDMFLESLEDVMPLSIPTSHLHRLSNKLTSSFQDGLNTSSAAMLPSHVYCLPSGSEMGTFLSVDLGGSTLRVALVKLSGLHRINENEKTINPMEMLELKSWSGKDIDHLKHFKGEEFFDWIALRIAEVSGKYAREGEPLPMGLSWSFPIEQTSIGSGKLQGMGKGFCVADDLLGTDLRAHFTNAFKRNNLNITLNAMVNDTVAALLSHAYIAPATRFSLIMGTGLNAAVSLPISALPKNKIPATAPTNAQNVLINTELSMFGKGILPVTKWDGILNNAMERPDFQPFEYLVSGGYLGEILRLIVVEGASGKGPFKNTLPESWKEPYSVETAFLAALEQNTVTPTSFASQYAASEPIQESDIKVLRSIAKHISNRVASYCAVGVHALYKFRQSTNPPDDSITLSPVSPVAFCGTVMEKYPTLQGRTQMALDRLVHWTPGTTNRQRLLLEFSHESAIYGAAVAVACHRCPTRISNASTMVDGPGETSTLDYTSSESICDKSEPPVLVSKGVVTENEISEKPKRSPWSWLVNFFKKIFARSKL